MSRLTRAEVASLYYREVVPQVARRYGLRDRAALSEAWGVLIDGLCRDGQITARQYATWQVPRLPRALLDALSGAE